MTFDFFEGAAGTGKTHNLVGRAGELVQDGVLGEGHKLLALTFMNGARRRLDARLGENPAFRRRFDCQTFDVFARTLAARRRSLITPAMQAQADALNEFDGPCALAAALLENEAVQQWVARSFPLVLVDEAQDLDEHRMRILQGLSSSCRIVAAADAFQCLHNGRDTAPLMGWLEGAGQTHRLTLVRRTNQQGLLAAALAVREGRDVKAVLTAKTFKNRTTWNGAGFRLLEAPATNANHALLAWSIANDIAQRQGPVVILTPDAGNAIIRAALSDRSDQAAYAQERRDVRAVSAHMGPSRQRRSRCLAGRYRIAGNGVLRRPARASNAVGRTRRRSRRPSAAWTACAARTGKRLSPPRKSPSSCGSPCATVRVWASGSNAAILP